MDAIPRQFRRFGTCARVLVSTSLAVGSAVTPFAQAQVFDYDFTTATSFDRANSTGIWNALSGQLQAGVVVGGSATKLLDFGDGSDGAFADGPSQTGITVSGNTITFDTTTKATFQFTSFSLSSGKTIVATGTQPLKILVLNNATIAGTLSANGSDGTPNQLASGYTAGGGGGAGGGTGGQGGSTSDAGGTPAGTGTPSSSPDRDGGKGGNAIASASIQGGGGGCNSAGTTPGSAGTNAGTTYGSCASTPASVAASLDTTLLGGAGGGGGGPRISTNVSSGSGGGGGGGAIRLSVLGSLTLTGAIQAKGGGGGVTDVGATSTTCGGGGGGGSGGTIWIQTLTSGGLSGSGSVNVSGGSGGGSTATGLCFGNDFPGGNGGSGVYRTDTPSGTQPWTTTPASTAQNLSVAILAGQSYTVLSKGLDRRSSLFSADQSSWATPTETFRTTGTYCGSTGSTSVVYEGSNDNSNWSSSVSASQVAAQLGSYRYLRFRVTFDTTSGTPPCLAHLTIPLDLAYLPMRGGFFFCATTQALRETDRSDVLAILINGLIVLLGPLALVIGPRTISRRFES